jgi:hypothetical protein
MSLASIHPRTVIARDAAFAAAGRTPVRAQPSASSVVAAAPNIP